MKLLQPRPLYTDRVLAFRDTEPIKVITGVRRCGKSSVLKLVMQHIIDSGVSDSHVFYRSFESIAQRYSCGTDFYQAIMQAKPSDENKFYLFFDEIQMQTDWADIVNSLHVDLDCDIYLSGSNSSLLSSEISSYLHGRCVQINMLPLSFREFIDFHGYHILDQDPSITNSHILLTDHNSHITDADDLFRTYLRFGGFPGLAELGFSLEETDPVLTDIYNGVVLKDILEREKRRGNSAVSDPILLERLIRFLADSIGSSISANSIAHVFENEGLLQHRKNSPSAHLIQAYIDAAVGSFIFYKADRYDIKGKEQLRTLGKYYMVDIGLRNHLLGYQETDTGHILENVVYLELLRRGYETAVGKLYQSEVDFVCTRTDEVCYYQVTESMHAGNVAERELDPLLKIKDNYPKYILTMDHPLASQQDGIQQLNLVSWLLGQSAH